MPSASASVQFQRAERVVVSSVWDRERTSADDNFRCSCLFKMLRKYCSPNKLRNLLLVRIAKELTGKDYILIAVCKVPAHNCGILTAADDSTGIELQLENT